MDEPMPTRALLAAIQYAVVLTAAILGLAFLAVQLAADGFADGGVGTVAADHVVGPHRARGPPVHAAGVLECHGHRVVVGGFIDGSAPDLPAVVGRPPRGRIRQPIKERHRPPPAVDASIRFLLLEAKLSAENIRYDKFS